MREKPQLLEPEGEEQLTSVWMSHMSAEQHFLC